MAQPVQASSYTFRRIIEGGYLYVDKTPYLYELIRGSIGIYFLARPRRFGKSLMISTLEEIFQGNRALFQTLWIAGSDYEWEKHPVIRFDFSRNAIKSAENLEQVIDYYLAEIADHYQVTLRGFNYQSRFDNLIQQLGREQPVVILIDEYDKPILDNLDHLAEAQKIRETLKNFYTVIKAMDQYIRFAFITGISRFSRVGIFSGMNNLTDITMTPRFAAALGITEAELTHYFSEHIAAFATREASGPDELLAKMRHWYNGFCFVEGCENVYNPYSTLQLFYNQRFANYWFETGTPAFLTKLIKERDFNIEPLAALKVPELTFSTYELERLELVPLLFQTGYLTIKDHQRDDYGHLYTLSYPNEEVRSAFFTYLLRAYNDVEIALSESYLRKLLYALANQDLPEFFNVLDIFFAGIDYDLSIQQEKYYQTIFYLIFQLLGVRTAAEVKANRGRIDAVIEINKRIYLFEFKLDGSAADALQQIRAHEYATRYRSQGKPITLIGANFDSKQRKITAWESAADQPVAAD